ncbi:hypothetical protein NB712_003977 [Xanthomonas sacchari]|nr:hypothetical protein [Xanthomonas sacchari]
MRSRHARWRRRNRAVPPPERAIVTPAEMSLMKLLFSIKHLLSSKKPLKSYAWYIWY